MDKFMADLEKAIVIKIIGQTEEYAKAVALNLYRDISATANEAGGLFGSPLWSGRFRASNNISVGSPDFSFLPPNPAAGRYPNAVNPQYPSNKISDAAAKIRSLKIGQVVFIANGLPYAKRIELDGWSAQVPNGVYRVAKERAIQKFDGIKLKNIEQLKGLQNG